MQPRANKRRKLGDHNVWRNDAVSLEGEVVEIKVGSEPRSFFVHSTVLQHNSAFFKAALSKRCTTDKTTPIELSEDDPKIFHEYVKYLYLNYMFKKFDEDDSDNGTSHQNQDKKEWRVLFQLYVLGEKLQDDGFMRRVLEIMLARIETDKFHIGERDHEEINLLFQGTVPYSPARRLVIDMIAWSGNYTYPSTADRSTYHHDFTFEVGRVMLEKRSKLPYEQKPYNFHSSWYLTNSGYASIDPKLYNLFRRLSVDSDNTNSGSD